MKAVVIPRPGAETVTLAEVPRPHIDRDELLVRMKAIGVGIHDSYFLPRDVHYPFPIGIEGAGVVEEVGQDVSGHRPGDAVAFVSMMQAKGGTWAEFAAVRASSLLLAIPAGMDFITAAALPVAGNTTLRTLHGFDDIGAGGSIFVAGGSGAIGTMAIQLARRRGWRVAASASPVNHEYMTSLGAERVVDYHDPDWTSQVRRWMPAGVDAAVAVHPGTAADTMRVVKDFGQLIPVSGDPVPAERGIRVGAIPHQVNVREELIQLMAEVADGRMHVEIEQVYPFEEAAAALAKSQTRQARGKNVVRVG